MIWYELQFKPLAPLHIGQKNYGVLAETRLFIPGWTMWGALVNVYGRRQGGREEDYRKGKKLFERLTCFYPQKEKGKVMFPSFREGRMYLGDDTEERFRSKYTDTYMSTALWAESIAAKDGSLHEIELLLPEAQGGGDALSWVGLLGIVKEDEADIINFLEKVKLIRVGGEATYGYGRMEQQGIKSVNEQELSEWGLSPDGSIGITPSFKNGSVPKYNNIKNYIELDPGLTLEKGKLEFIVQYDFSGAPPIICRKGYYLVPGSSFIQERGKKVRFTLKKGFFIGRGNSSAPNSIKTD